MHRLEIGARDGFRREENGDEDDVEFDYAVSDELWSCSSIDDDELDPTRPRYAEFNEKFDMKDPQL